MFREHNFKTFFNVDNCVSSVADKSELLQFICVVTNIMGEAKFELREWESSFISEIDVFVTSVTIMELTEECADDK